MFLQENSEGDNYPCEMRIMPISKADVRIRDHCAKHLTHQHHSITGRIVDCFCCLSLCQ